MSGKPIMSGGPIISLVGVTRRFHQGAQTITALDNVSLEIFGGELTVAAGPSGSGKTTLLSVIAGLEVPDEGVVRTHEPLPAKVPTAALSWRQLAFVPQALALLDELTVRENIDLPAMLDAARSAGRRKSFAGRGKNRGATRAEGGATRAEGGADWAAGGAGWSTRGADWSVDGGYRPHSHQPHNGSAHRDGDRRHEVDRLLHALELAHLADRHPSHTSGGEQQRTALARALRLRPVVLIADEPTGHQDRARVDVVLEILRQHAYSGAAVLISSHDEAVIAGADRVVTLADGRVAADERPRSIRYTR